MVALVVLASVAACGGGPTNTVLTKEDASKIRTAVNGPMARVGSEGQVDCPQGGTVKSKTSLGIDLLKGESSITRTIDFTGCVSEGVTVSGSLSEVTKTTASGSSISQSGHVETSLGSCIVDLQRSTSSAAITGDFCGFDFNTVP